MEKRQQEISSSQDDDFGTVENIMEGKGENLYNYDNRGSRTDTPEEDQESSSYADSSQEAVDTSSEEEKFGLSLKNHSRYTNDEHRFEQFGRIQTLSDSSNSEGDEEPRERSDSEKFSEEDQEGHDEPPKQDIKIDRWNILLNKLSAEEIEKIESENDRIWKDANQEFKNQQQIEQQKIEDENIQIGDRIYIKCYDRYKKKIQYLEVLNSKGECEWINEREKADYFDIIPVINGAQNSITKSYLNRNTNPNPDAEVDNRVRQGWYESEVQTVESNLTYLEKAQKYPLNLNQPFSFKNVRCKIYQYSFTLDDSNENVNVKTWFLQGINDNTQEVSIKPRNSYYLCTIVHNSFYYLKANSDLLVKEKEQAVQIELNVKIKNLRDTFDKVQQRVNNNKPLILFNNKSEFLNFNGLYSSKDDMTKNTKREVIASEYTSFMDIPFQNYFEVQYLYIQRKIFFKTRLEYYDPFNGTKDSKYLGVENDILTLVDHCYLFELTDLKQGQILLGNQQFKINICNSDMLLRSVNSHEEGMSKIIVSKFDPDKTDEFYFHLRHVNYLYLTSRDICSIDEKISKTKKNLLEQYDRNNSENTVDHLEEIYITAKKLIDEFLWKVTFKELNRDRPSSWKRMCIYGYFNLNLLSILNKTYRFEVLMNQVKQLRKDLIREGADLYYFHMPPKSYYAVCCEYILALGFWGRKTGFSVVLKKAKEVITLSQECAENNNDSRLIMLIQRIIGKNYKLNNQNIAASDPKIYELRCFLPFIKYELDKGINKSNLSILLAIVSNKYRDQHCVWSNEGFNYAVIKFICTQLEDNVNQIHFSTKSTSEGTAGPEIISMHDMIQDSCNYAKRKLEDQTFNEDMFFNSRKSAFIMNHTQNKFFRNLMLLILYSYGIRFGLQDGKELSKKWNPFIIENLYNSEVTSHIKGLLLKLYCNMNIVSNESQNSLFNNVNDSIKILRSSIEVLEFLQDSCIIEDLFYICEILEFIICMLHNSHYTNDALSELNKMDNLNLLIQVLRRLSSVFILAKPYAFDSILNTKLDDHELMLANEAAVNNCCHEVDVVLESYQKEVVTKIFKLFNIIINIKNSHKQKEEFEGHFLYLPDIISNSFLSDSIEFSDTLQMIIIRWMNFDLESQISSEIFDTLLHLDCQSEELSNKLQEENNLNGEISDLCLKTLPFFTHLDEKDAEIVLRLNKRIVEITEDQIRAFDSNLEQSYSYEDQAHITRSLISLLATINGLLDFKDNIKEDCIQIVNQFVCNCYEYLIETARNKHLAQLIWAFDGNFLAINWQNQLCNSKHQRLIEEVLDNSNVEKLNLDSCDLLKKIASNLGQLIEDRQELINGDVDPGLRKMYGFERNRTKNDQNIFQYFIKRIVQNAQEDSNPNEQRLGIKNEDNWNPELEVLDDNTKSCFIKCIIELFLRKLKTDTDECVEITRKFQLLINKLFHNIDTLEPAFDTQKYILHSLKMLHEILDTDKIMENSEISEMFFTKNAFSVIFSLILKSYNYLECARKMRQSALSILIKLAKKNIQSSRKSFRIWTYSNDNINIFFKRIIRLASQFSIYFIDEHISDSLSIDQEETDYQEFILSLKWLMKLCQNNHHWQNYLNKQDNIVKNHNILVSIVEVLRTGCLRLHHGYVVDLLREVVKLMTETLNGRNEVLASLYVNTAVVQYCIKILEAEFTRVDLQFVRKINKSSHFKIMKNMSEEDRHDFEMEILEDKDFIHDQRKWFNQLKCEVLLMINCLSFSHTEHQIKTKENYESINSFMILNYVQFCIYKDQRYTSELFDSKSNLSKIYNINLGFQCYSLISELWDNNGQDPSNCVQLADQQGFLAKYLKLFRDLCFKINPFRNRYTPITEADYKPFEKQKNLAIQATNFYDSYSSSIEIVMADGQIVTRYFEIVSPFLLFTQDEKDKFWLDANLDDSKTTVNSFVKYTADKIEEL
ncbi:unnamed protein product [Moneuplotes crassus]|uniref:Uncharacterized protein n=1 Tax=Euplotes crassus TaxID=5936 RepID=A0AAD1X5N7_EUPCR|nr:unnamed protein product [Moneuplotes crassus]